MAQEAVFTVLQRGGAIAVDEAKYLLGVSDKVESTKKQLKRMQGFLQDVDDRMRSGGAMAKNLVSDVREVAYEVDDIIDYANILTRQSDPKTSITGAISKYVFFPIYLTRLHRLGARIDSANAKINTIFEHFEMLHIAATAITKEPQVSITEDDTTQQWRSVHPDFGEQVDVIGFNKQIEKIKIGLLDTGNKHLTVVSIVGPGGAGKSTMAKKVYGLAAVKGHFQAVTWITVSQRFIPRDLVREMINHAMGPEQAESLEKKTEHEVKKFLHDFLRGERYLIVLDDVWSTTAWDLIRDVFPDEKNGSRVVLTTRNESVARHPNARKEIYKPKLLNKEESTQLLHSRAIPGYMLDDNNNSHAAVNVRRNLDKFKKLGKDLAVKCRGLPLALTVLGGYLSRNLDVAEWKRLTNSMDLQAMISGEVIGAVLDFSYYDMPSNLRSCFMYTTAFPEDSSIDVRVLTSLWIAEGFIPLERRHSQEEVALKYVIELVQRCMIQVHDKERSGRITSIKVHDILRDWGMGRARREGFLKDCHAAEDLEMAYSEETVDAYRVAFRVTMEEKVRTSIGQHRSLLYFELSTDIGRTKAKLLQYFRHLRVLYIHAPRTTTLPMEISLMRYLRYLGLGGKATYILPSSIGDFLSLETLYAPDALVNDIPISLWKIPTLRQVYIPCCQSWSVSRRISSLSKVKAVVGCITVDTYGTYKSKQMLEEIKHQVSENKNRSFSFCYIAWYNSWTEMEIAGRYGEVVRFPDTLAHITKLAILNVLKICCFNLCSNDQNILELGCLYRLMVLEIGDQSYTGSVITCSSGSFPRLEWLVLHDLAVEDWIIEDGCMERLRVLTVCKCPNLTRLPEGLLLLPNLVKVELIAMPPDCYQQGTVIQELKKKGCVVSISSDEKNFKHLDVPLGDGPDRGIDAAIESAIKSDAW